MARPNQPPQWFPTDDDIKEATKDVAWEYAALLAYAQVAAQGLGTPINHLAQDAVLVHLRTLAEFFERRVAEFRVASVKPLRRVEDDIFAVDFCKQVSWTPLPKNSNLWRAVNKTLSHLTYSRNLTNPRSEISIAFDSNQHLHGTVVLMRRMWSTFLGVDVEAKYKDLLTDWLECHAKGLGVRLTSFDVDFADLCRKSKWTMNQTPDGTI